MLNDLTLIYEGTDITGMVSVAEAVHADVSRGGCDGLKLTLEYAKTWFRWGPKPGDEIRVKRNGYDTGTLYLNTILPEDGKYRIFATGVRPGGRFHRYESFHNLTLGQIMNISAAQLGMGARAFGMRALAPYPYMPRLGQTPAAFIEWLAGCEGALLKANGGYLNAISLEYAQGLDAAHSVELDVSKPGVRYIDRRSERWGSVKLIGPSFEGEALDLAAAGMEAQAFCDLPIHDPAQAKRWAQGLLTLHNRALECLIVESAFNPGMTALARVDVSGGELAGRWIVDRVTHDFKHDSTEARMYRCIETVR